MDTVYHEAIDMWQMALILAFVWGGIWAAFLQRTALGRFLAIKRTWLTVVVGVGGDLLLLLLILDWLLWLKVLGIITASSLLIIARSLYNELRETNEVLDLIGNQANGHQDQARQ